MSKNTLRIKKNLNGWLIIDKPLHIGSTPVVSKLKWSLSPCKIGHAGTLDPLATGVLPIALGQATKLIPFVMDGKKIYEFQVTFGCETTTDDAAGEVINNSQNRPTEEQIKNILPHFIGTILQIPPIYSALKINGERAYDLARNGQDLQLSPRPVQIDTLELLKFTGDTADFRVSCGKGTYVRSLGRDIGRMLGCFGHITVLRRLKCGPFQISDTTPLSVFETKQDTIKLLPMNTALNNFPTLILSEAEEKRLKQGQRIPVRQLSTQPTITDLQDVFCLKYQDKIIGLGKCIHNIIQPYRIFNDTDT